MTVTNQDTIIIVGAGQCGLKAVEALRRAGYDGELLLIGDEPYAPYQRPPLSKAFLKGEMDQDRLLLTSEAYFAAHNVDTMFASRVISIDTTAKTIDIDTDRQRRRYSKLLLATGTRARKLDIPGIHLPGVYSLRTLDDTKYLASAVLSDNPQIAIVGGGYIGLEVAASMRAHGHRVTIVESADRLLNRVVCPQVSQFFEDLHRRYGVNIVKDTMPTRLLGEQQVAGIELANGDIVKCDIVLVGVGSVPDVDLAVAAGITTDNGIKVDPACQTSVPDVYAAGDCTSFPSHRYGRFIRLQSVQNAIDQGKAAAHAMLGEATSYDPLPWFWSDQYDVKLQIVGLSQGYDRVEIEPGKNAESFAVTYFKNEQPICVDAINYPRAYLQARRALETSSLD